MPDLATLAPLLVLILAIGAFAGIVAGLLGVGGGIILVPAFFFTFQALGYDAPDLIQICLATSLATIIVTSLRSLMAHHKKGAVAWPILIRWAPGIALGAILGVMATEGLAPQALMAIFGCLGVLVGLYFGFGNPDWRLGNSMPGPIGRTITAPILGFLSVLMGIGGGSFGVPLMSLYGTPIHRAVATASGFGVVIAVPSVLGFLLVQGASEGRPPMMLGQVNLVAFALVVTMTFLTAPLGARLAHAMDPGPLRRVFVVFIMVMALNMLREAIW